MSKQAETPAPAPAPAPPAPAQAAPAPPAPAAAEISTSDINLTLKAVKSCISDQELVLSETYLFIILFILFYITTSRAYGLMIDARKLSCQENIRRSEYDDFISGFVYWVISFCIIIFIKYNGINLINKFIISKELNTVGSTEKNYVDRAKYVGQSLITGFTSILNIYFVIILLLTLYFIIDKTIDLIKCKSEVCTKFNLCKEGDASKARYYNNDNGVCYDSNFKDISELDKNNNNNNSKPSFTSKLDEKEGIDGRLKENFYPSWIMKIIQGNLSGWTGRVINIIVILLLCGFYILKGNENPMLYYIIIGVYIIINVIVNLWRSSDYTNYN